MSEPSGLVDDGLVVVRIRRGGMREQIREMILRGATSVKFEFLGGVSGESDVDVEGTNHGQSTAGNTQEMNGE